MIESPLLVNLAGYVAGRWTSARSGSTIAVIDPATGERLASVPDMASAETSDAVEAAVRVLSSPVSIQQRREWLVETAKLILENRDEIARIITREQGKPLKESIVEVEYAAGFFRYYSTQLERLAPQPLTEPIRNLRWTVHHRPAGVAGLITPWNFPLGMLAKKLAPAIAAGCAVVVKPSELTPLTAIALWNLLERIGAPPGWLNLVIGQPVPIGEVLFSHPAVRLISFTGSTAVGRALISESAPQIKRLALELGGNAPFVVMDDADIGVVVDALMANKFRCAGQTCVCANRVYVQRGIERSFASAMADRVSRLTMGNGMEPRVDIGPLINRDAFDKVALHVEDAVKRGASRIAGSVASRPQEDWGAFYPPTVLTGVNAGMQLSMEETFGPVVAIETFDSDEEAVEKANGTPFGLAAYLFTGDAARASAMLTRLHFGHVGLNTGSGPTPEAPFGGMKQSGIGREGGVEGLYEFCEIQTVAAL